LKITLFTIKVIDEKKLFYKKIILSNYRSAIISKRLVGLRINVYNGAWLLTKTLDERMVGRKIGEFSMSKRRWAIYLMQLVLDWGEHLIEEIFVTYR
jgi:ribosomal protein S19